MKKGLQVLLILAFSFFWVLGAGNAIATSIYDNGYEDTLQEVLNSITFGGNSSVDVDTDQIPDTSDSYWSIADSDGALATFIIEIAGYAPYNTFGIYSGTESVEVFSGSDSIGNQTSISIKADGSVWLNDNNTNVVFSGNRFGFYLGVPQGYTYYSDTSLNPDGFDHMVAFQGKGDTIEIENLNPIDWTSDKSIVAFEDLYNGGDKDYNDMVIMVDSVALIPEPTSIILLGSGLAGLAVIRKKFKVRS